MRLIQYLFLVLMLSVTSTVLAHPSAKPPFQEVKWPASDFALNDASGDLWVAASSGRPIAYHLTKSGWITHTASSAEYGRTTLFAGTGHDMFMLCRNENNEAEVIFHFDDTGATKFADSSASLRTTLITATADGGIWLSGTTRHMEHLTRQGLADIEYDIPDDAIIQRNNLGPDMPPSYKFQSVRDMRGQIWFWSNYAISATNTRIRGLLMWSGQKMKVYSRISGLPTTALLCVVPQDSSHLWVTVSEYGLFRVDTDTMEAIHLQQKNSQTLEFVTQLVSSYNGCYMIDYTYEPGASEIGVLWRIEIIGKGGKIHFTKWTCVQHGLYSITDNGNAMCIGVLGGIWIGTDGNGLWWIPDSGHPVHLDWRRGLTSNSIYALTKIPGDRIVATMPANLNFSDEAHYILPRTPPSNTNEIDINVEVIPKHNLGTKHLRLDSHRHLWGLRSPESGSLDEWDGIGWKVHLLPQKSQGLGYDEVTIDNEDRIWCLSYEKLPGDTSRNNTAMFDPKTGSWQIFSNYDTALASHHLDRNFSLLSQHRSSPIFNGNKIAYRGYKYHYFDGMTWQDWSEGDITKSEELRDLYFNAQGHLCIRGLVNDWIWIDKRWRPFSSSYVWPNDKEIKSLSVLPDTLKRKTYFQAAEPDGDGGLWFISIYGDVYRYWEGLSFTVFDASQPNPFGARPSKYNIDVDSKRCFWFQTSSEEVGPTLRVSPGITNHKISFTLTQQDTDSVTATIRGAGKKDVLGWSLDDLPMTRAAKSSKTWRCISPGIHHIALYALDKHGLPSLVQTSGAINVTTSPNIHIAHLIEALKDSSDAERDDILSHLAEYGQRALPALRDAEKSANPTWRWWIETAIQSIVMPSVSQAPSVTSQIKIGPSN